MSATDAEKREAARRLIATLTAPGAHFVGPSRPAKCRGCDRVEELREGFCFPCLEPFVTVEGNRIVRAKGRPS